MSYTHILITGGTFDKTYDYVSGKLFFKKFHIPEMLNRSRCKLDNKVNTLMMIDGLDMIESDVNKIVDTCKKSNSNKIIITHGTDTMTRTAKKIALSKIENKTIVLTGAIVPYAFGSSSYGFFNLGYALSFAQNSDYGVHICMNGKTFKWNEVKKNKSTGIFEQLV